MKRTLLTALLFGFALSCTTRAGAQERGNWRAASKSAQSILGDIVFGTDKLAINFATFPVSQIRPLSAAEISAGFDGADASEGVGHLYRLSIPGERRFLHKNTLCGSDETQWMATYVAGKELRIAFFSNASPPVFTIEAFINNPNLCGTYLYSR